MSRQVYHERKKFVKFLWKNVPGLGAAVITTKDGDVLESETSIEFEKEFAYSYLMHIAKVASKRFSFEDLKEGMGVLGLTINVFKKHTMLVTPIDLEQILILIVPNETDIESSVGFVSNIEQFYKP